MGKRTTGSIWRNKAIHLHSDMSKFATGSALYQIQNGKPRVIAYVSKRLPEAVRSYSIKELKSYVV